MNGLVTKSPAECSETSFDFDDLDSLKEFIIPKLLSKNIKKKLTPDGKEILYDVKPQVEIERKFCPDVRRTSSYPDITRKAEPVSDIELQLKRQKIVNTELKRLLIASVGDTLATKLEDIAVEKTELNNQVNALTRQAALDAEKIENLAIQGDIWKSKFLATRVVVNELNVWKSTVTSQLYYTQKLMSSFDEHRKNVCYVLNEADSALSESITHIREKNSDMDAVLEKLKVTSERITKMLEAHTKDMCSYNQAMFSVPPEPVMAASLHVNESHYTYSSIVPLSPSCTPDLSVCNGVTGCCDHRSDFYKETLSPLNANFTVGGCNCCSKRQILHL